MRILGHMLFALFAASVLAGLGWKLWHVLNQSQVFGAAGEFRDLVRSTVYEVPEDGWIEFPLPTRSGLKVLSTALVGTDESLLTTQRWGYTLAYQLVGRGGVPIREWTYHYRAGVTRYIDVETGRFQPRSYVADIQAVPADSRVTRISTMELGDATALRVRLLDRHPGLQQVLLRCYVRESVAEHKLPFLWQRLDPEKRERIARVSVFGAEFLRTEEQYNLLRWQWSPIGPSGVHQEDYRSQVLVVLNDALGESVDEEVLPEGIYADSRTRGMLSLPEGHWDLRLELIAADAEHRPVDGSPVRVRWYGKAGEEPWEVSLDPDIRSPYMRQSVTAGVLEVVSETPVIARVYLSGNDRTFMLRSEQRRIRTYLAGEDQPLDYRIEHVGDAATPFRIDLRCIRADGESLTGTVGYQLLDEGGKELASGHIAVDQSLSLYDRIANPLSGERVCDPLRRYFYLPPEVAVLRLSAAEPVLIAAYSRPDDLQRRTRVPEDYQDLAWDPQRQPAWFMLRPVEYESLRLQQRSLQLVLQARPPEPDPRIAAGHYEWKEYRPGGQWRARELLVPRTSGQRVQERSRAGVFSPVPANRDLTVQLAGQTGRRQVAPTLIYVGETAEPADVSVELDGKVTAATRIFSPRSRLRLPLLPVGERRLHIRTTAPGTWWMNYSGDGENARLLRKVLHVNDEALLFDYFKQGSEQEVISGALFCDSSARVELRASVDAVRSADMNPRKDWTFLERSYDVQVDPLQTVPVLDTPDVSVKSGQVFFLPLGEDLDAGNYRISVSMASGESCYLNLHRIIPGQPLLRRFFRERDLLAAGELH